MTFIYGRRHSFFNQLQLKEMYLIIAQNIDNDYETINIIDNRRSQKMQNMV